MATQLISFPFPTKHTPTLTLEARAFDTCLRTLHPHHAKRGGLTEDQQFDCFDQVGIQRWDDVMDLDGATTVRLAEAVTSLLAM